MRTGGQGGHFSATDKQDTRMTNQLKSKCNNFVLTEGMGVRPPRNWAVTGTETRTYFDKHVWHSTEGFRLIIPTTDWIRGSRKMDHVAIELVHLVHVGGDGTTALIGGGHMPAHLNVRSQRLANEAAFAGLRKAVLPVMKDLAPDITTLFFDINRDLKLEKNEALVKKSVRGTGLKLVKLPKPDLKNRFISCFLTTGSKPETDMLDRVFGYDHQGGLLTVTL